MTRFIKLLHDLINDENNWKEIFKLALENEYESYKEKRRIVEKNQSLEEQEKEMKQMRLDLKSKKKE